jgi:hypothetical protein
MRLKWSFANLSNRKNYAAELFQLPDLILDQMPLLVEVRVNLARRFVVDARRDDCCGLLPLQVQDDLGTVVVIGRIPPAYFGNSKFMFPPVSEER